MCSKKRLNRQFYSILALCIHLYKMVVFLQAKFHLLDKTTGSLVSTEYTTDPLFVFHHINAYESGSHVVIDVCAHGNTEVVYALSIEDGSAFTGERASLKRFVLPIDADKATGILGCVQLLIIIFVMLLFMITRGCD